MHADCVYARPCGCIRHPHCIAVIIAVFALYCAFCLPEEKPVKLADLFAPYSGVLGAGLVRTLLTGSCGAQTVASMTASLMAGITGYDVAHTGTRKGGRVLAGAPVVLPVDGSISEYYLKVVKEMRQRGKQSCGCAIASSRKLRNACWHEAAKIMTKKAKGTLSKTMPLSEAERLAHENQLAMHTFAESTKSFVAGRVRVRHPALHNAKGLASVRRILESRGISCTLNAVAGSALLTYDASKMTEKQFCQAVLPFARTLCFA